MTVINIIIFWASLGIQCSLAIFGITAGNHGRICGRLYRYKTSAAEFPMIELPNPGELMIWSL